MLFLSRLSPQKGLDILIPAFARFTQSDQSGAKLVLAGPDYDGYEQGVRAMIARENIAGRVLFTGMIRDQQRIEALVDADLFVLPSHHENFGIVVAEAMAAGAPVLISREVNIWPDVVAARAGAVVPAEAEKVAMEMMRWMADPALRSEAGHCGRQFTLDHYGWDAIASHWINHYQQLAGLPQ